MFPHLPRTWRNPGQSRTEKDTKMTNEQLYALIRHLLVLLGAAAMSYGWFSLTDPKTALAPIELPVWWWGAL